MFELVNEEDGTCIRVGENENLKKYANYTFSSTEKMIRHLTENYVDPNIITPLQLLRLCTAKMYDGASGLRNFNTLLEQIKTTLYTRGGCREHE